MKPLLSLLTVALLVVGAAAQNAVPDPSDPAAVLAARLRADRAERVKAGATLESFLLKPDEAGKSFVGADADRVALAAVAREWAEKADPAAVAPLIIAAGPGSSIHPKLRAALARYTDSAQIRRASAAAATSAFFVDAQAQAAKLYSEPGARASLSISSNESAVAVPGGAAALERARALSTRGAGVSKGVFGPDRGAQDLNGQPGAEGGPRPSGGAPKSGEPGAAPAEASMLRASSVVKSASAATPANAPAAQLPRSQGRPDGISVPAPGVAVQSANTAGVPAGSNATTPNDGRVVPKDVSAWERIKEGFTSPLSDAYGFTFEGLEAAPVAFRDSKPALAYAKKAKDSSFTKVIFYGHGAPGYMTVGEWGADAGDISNMLNGKMKVNSLIEIKGCNTSSIGGSSINPARGISALTRRVMYFSVPYLMSDRSERDREQLENEWDSDLARDVSVKIRGVKVCGFRTFGLVASRIPVVGTMMGNREATDSNAIGGSKACYINGVEVDK